MSKFLILTSITGGKDDLILPLEKFEDCDYVAFVDQKYPVEIWEQRAAFDFSRIDQISSRRNAKVFKILACNLFPEYEYIFWQDGNHHLAKHPSEIIQEYGDFDLLCFRHPDRNCSYDEAMAVARWSLDVIDNILAQAKFYISKGYPKNQGLYELSTFVRKRSEPVLQFEQMWWEQICKYSSRDQVSFPFVLWQLRKLLKLRVFKGAANLNGMKGNTGGNEYYIDTGSHKR